MNPWLLAAAVFGAIGLLTEVFGDPKDKPRILPAPEKDKKRDTHVTVNVDKTPVQSTVKGPKQKVPKKVAAKVPDDKPTDG